MAVTVDNIIVEIGLAFVFFSFFQLASISADKAVFNLICSGQYNTKQYSIALPTNQLSKPTKPVCKGFTLVYSMVSMSWAPELAVNDTAGVAVTMQHEGIYVL